MPSASRAFFPTCLFNTLYKTFAWQTFASLRLFTCPVYVSTYCVPIARFVSNTLFGPRPNKNSSIIRCFNAVLRNIKMIRCIYLSSCVFMSRSIPAALTVSDRIQIPSKIIHKDTGTQVKYILCYLIIILCYLTIIRRRLS